MTERKHIDVELKAADEEGFLEGYASVFGNVDGHGDVVAPGAFKKTIAERLGKGQIKLLDSHHPDTDHLIGTLVSAKEDATGLKVRAKLATTERALRVKSLVAEGHLRSMSIGYVPVKWSFKDQDGQRVRVLDEVKLYEASVVVMPANELAAITSVKSAFDALAEDVEHWTPEAKSAAVAELDRLRETIEGKSSDDGAEVDEVDPPAEPAAEAEPEVKEEQDPERVARDLVRRSKAILEGRDPDATAAPESVAGNEQRLALAEREMERIERALAAKDAESDELVADVDRRFEMKQAEAERIAAAKELADTLAEFGDTIRAS